jgi:hypothetical protein
LGKDGLASRLGIGSALGRAVRDEESAAREPSGDGRGAVVGSVGRIKPGPALVDLPWLKVVILSASASNLVPCVESLTTNEPDLPIDHVIVVDDGARAEAEALLPGVQWVEGVKPFVFARNANLGLRRAGADAILLNDDALLVTPGGLSALARFARAQPEIGICSAGIRGRVANRRQHPAIPGGFRFEDETLAFVCVYIPSAVYESVGPLDERFVGYGFEDNDYCARVRNAGYRLGIWDECVVDHSGQLPHTYISRPDYKTLYNENKKIFLSKVNGDTGSTDHK